jgi:hypothetical protein
MKNEKLNILLWNLLFSIPSFFYCMFLVSILTNVNFTMQLIISFLYYIHTAVNDSKIDFLTNRINKLENDKLK